MKQRERVGPVETGRPHYSIVNNTNGLTDVRRIDVNNELEMKKPASVNTQLQKKLDRCFGLFDDVRKYLTFKDFDDHYNNAANSHASQPSSSAPNSQLRRHKVNPVTHTNHAHNGKNRPGDNADVTAAIIPHHGSASSGAGAPKSIDKRSSDHGNGRILKPSDGDFVAKRVEPKTNATTVVDGSDLTDKKPRSSTGDHHHYRDGGKHHKAYSDSKPHSDSNKPYSDSSVKPRSTPACSDSSTANRERVVPTAAKQRPHLNVKTEDAERDIVPTCSTKSSTFKDISSLIKKANESVAPPLTAIAATHVNQPVFTFPENKSCDSKILSNPTDELSRSRHDCVEIPCGKISRNEQVEKVSANSTNRAEEEIGQNKDFRSKLDEDLRLSEDDDEKDAEGKLTVIKGKINNYFNEDIGLAEDRPTIIDSKCKKISEIQRNNKTAEKDRCSISGGGKLKHELTVALAAPSSQGTVQSTSNCNYGNNNSVLVRKQALRTITATQASLMLKSEKPGCESEHITTSAHSLHKATNSSNDISNTAIHKGSAMAAGNNKPAAPANVVDSTPPTKQPGDKSRAWDLNMFLNILTPSCNDEPPVANDDASTSSAVANEALTRENDVSTGIVQPGVNVVETSGDHVATSTNRLVVASRATTREDDVSTGAASGTKPSTSGDSSSGGRPCGGRSSADGKKRKKFKADDGDRSTAHEHKSAATATSSSGRPPVQDSPGKENDSTRAVSHFPAPSVKIVSPDDEKSSGVVKKSSTISTEKPSSSSARRKWGAAPASSSSTAKIFADGDDHHDPAPSVVLSDVRKVMAAVMSKKSRLSPLLSPIREFPCLQFKNGRPSLMCRLPLTLLKNVPQPCPADSYSNPSTTVINDKGKSDKRVNNDRCGKDDAVVAKTCDDVIERNGAIASTAAPTSDASSSPLVHSKNSAFTSLAKNRPTMAVAPSRPAVVADHLEPPGAAPEPSSGRDLDDVPISERRKSLCKLTSSPCHQSNVKHGPKKGRVAPPTVDDGGPPRLSPETTPVVEAPCVTLSSNKSDALPATTDLCSLSSSFPNEQTKPCAVSGLKVTTKHKFFDPEGTKSIEESPKKPKYDNSFLMAAAPEKPLPIDCNVKDFKFYMAKAKEYKHQADGQASDRVLRLIMYLESICYFFLTGYWMEKTMSKESQIPYNMIKDTRDLLSNVIEKKLPQLNELNERMQALFSHKLDILALRVHSLLMCHMFSMRHSLAYTNYRHITDYQRQAGKDRPSSVHGVGPSACGPGGGQPGRPAGANGAPTSAPSACSAASSSTESRAGGAGPTSGPSAPPPQSSTPSPTPSPASSTGSSSHSLPPGLVAIPQHVESLYKQQLQHLHNLFLAHHQWLVADGKQKQHDYAFFNHLDSICRPLTLTSNVPSVCIYVLTAVHWLRLLNDQQKISR